MNFASFVIIISILVLHLAILSIQGVELSNSQCLVNTHLLHYFNRGTRLTGKVFQKEDTYSLRRCIKECLIQKRCGIITYDEDNLVCELARNGSNVSTTADQHYVTSSRESWSTNLNHLAGACSENPCSERERCITLTSGSIHCLVIYRCGKDWIHHDGKCYLIGMPYATDWDTAQNECVQRGGSLARIDSASVNNFLAIQLRINGISYSYFAANDRQQEGVWRWGDSDDLVNYTNWRNGEPNGEPNDRNDIDEDCAFFGLDGEWFDIDCPRRIPYICETEVLV